MSVRGGSSEASTHAGHAQVAALSVGSVVDGKYKIESTIAEGGMAVILRATHVGLGQRVAIKFLKPRALSEPAVVERFEREARLAAQITSDHVVRVQDVGNVAGVGPYMVMEYLVGRDLGSIVEEGPLPIARAVDYLLQACDALAEAHALRIVHRDIKPENMFLAQRPSNTAILKIIDFGISKVAPKRGEGGDWAHSTDREDRLGTPLYMSPEQLRSAADVDQRADIWALGVVLFELITGVSAFDATDMPELCVSILTAAPKSLRALLPDAPEGLEGVILRCLEKDPARRYRNVAELTQDLVPFGPASTESRVVRIKQVVRRGGSSIRPPTPPAMAVQSVPIAMASVIVAASDRRVTTARRSRVRGWPLRWTGAAGLAALVTVVIGLVALTRGSAAPDPVVTVAPIATVVPSASAPTQEPTQVAPETVAASTATSEVGVPPVPPPKKTGNTHSPAAASVARPSDRRTLFGERK
jgi:serine/threonine protein kinase